MSSQAEPQSAPTDPDGTMDRRDLHASDASAGDGSAPAEAAPARLLPLYRLMVLARALDMRLTEEVRTGALEAWKAGRCEGALVGAASALAQGDWLFAGAYDFAASLARGVPLSDALAHVFGVSGDCTKGRTPAGSARLASHELALGSYGFHNGAHLTHAAGVAWAAKIRGDKAVALALFDGDEISGGEFHNALNFAGVFRLPVVFVAVRKGDVPAASHRGIAYGVPTAVADGGNVLDVVSKVAAAISCAREGGGATLIEITHDEANVDALARCESELESRGLDSECRAAKEAADRDVDAAVSRARAAAPVPPATLFDDVYASVPAHLADQRAGLRTR